MELSVAEGRVLGCLVEKQVTEAADSYAMTLDELRFSCNQTSGRDPVVAFDDRTVEDTVLSLKAMGLARFVTIGHRAGPITYRHRADERWRLALPELAVLSMLLLRGPQTVDELWALLQDQDVIGGTTGIAVALDTLAGRTPTPLAARLARSGEPDSVSWVEVLTGRYTLDSVDGYDGGSPPPSRRGSGLPAREPWRPDERFDTRARRNQPPARRDVIDERRGSGLPAREPWRPDERFDTRSRRSDAPAQRDLFDEGNGRGPLDPTDRNDPDRDDRRGTRGRRDEPDLFDQQDSRQLADRQPAERQLADPRSERADDRRDQGRRRDPDEARDRRDPQDRERRLPDDRSEPAPSTPSTLVPSDLQVPMAVPAHLARQASPTLTELADRLSRIERRLAGIEAALAELRPESLAAAASSSPPPSRSQLQPQPPPPPPPPPPPRQSGPPARPQQPTGPRSHR